tara:strand:- start:3125 stop:3415 length:291 start_codon:yes stop_codon:yes gene_type:complete
LDPFPRLAYLADALNQVDVVARPVASVTPSEVARPTKRFEIVQIGNLQLQRIVADRQRMVGVVASDPTWRLSADRAVWLRVGLGSLRLANIRAVVR